MRRAQLGLVTACLLAFVAAFVGCNGSDTTPQPPENNGGSTTQTGTETPVAPPPVAEGPKRTFEIDPDNSAVEWNAHVPIGTRVGGWTTFEGAFEMTGDSIETLQGTVTVDMNSAYSDAVEITNKLKGDEHFFQPKEHPTSTFKLSSVKKGAAGYDVVGDFTIRGITKSFTFPAEIEVKEGTLTAKAKFDMNRQDFGITYQSTIGDYAINDICQLILDIVANEKAAAAPAAAPAAATDAPAAAPGA
ncbi:MAG: YceI family protein [Candidatus Hydrogenedentes bacterium]|nr:YceI family protein [Candidatus Hydrogenedentota bacterium]